MNSQGISNHGRGWALDLPADMPQEEKDRFTLQVKRLGEMDPAGLATFDMLVSLLERMEAEGESIVLNWQQETGQWECTFRVGNAPFSATHSHPYLAAAMAHTLANAHRLQITPVEAVGHDQFESK